MSRRQNTAESADFHTTSALEPDEELYIVDGLNRDIVASHTTPIYTDFVTGCVAVGFYDSEESSAVAAHWPIESLEIEEIKEGLIDFSTQVYEHTTEESAEAAIIGASREKEPARSEARDFLESERQINHSAYTNAKLGIIKDVTTNLAGGPESVIDRTKERDIDALHINPENGFNFLDEETFEHPEERYGL